MENAENVVVLTTDVKNTESTKEESAEKDALLMTNVRDVAISKEENTATLVTDVKAATISKAVP